MIRRFILLSTLASTGCAGYLDRTQHAPLVAAPEDYDEEPAPTAPAEGETEPVPAITPPVEYEESPAISPSRWGMALGAPALDPILVEALEANYSVAAAVQRIRRSEAIANQVRALRMPRVTGQASASYASTVRPPFGRSSSWAVGFSVPVTYEVDLFGRYASDHRSSRLDAAAAERDAEAVAISIAAQTAEAYFDLVEVRARGALLRAQLETNSRFLELVTYRFERGLTSAVDVHQQRQLVAATEAQLALIGGEEAVIENQLAILVGVPPGRTFAAGEATLPDLPAPPVVGAPADLLARRPDLLAADLRLHAADARVAGAVRSRLPALQLSFTPGYDIARTTYSDGAASSFLNQDIVRGFNWSAGAALSVPIFDGLFGRAQTEQRRAEVDEALASYRDAYLAALVEVENAVALERQQRENITQLEREVEFAAATLEATQGRYRAGLSDYLPVLTALRTMQAAELRLLAARRQLVSHRLQLYRALGAAIDVDSESESR